MSDFVHARERYGVPSIGPSSLSPAGEYGWGDSRVHVHSTGHVSGLVRHDTLHWDRPGEQEQAFRGHARAIGFRCLSLGWFKRAKERL